MKVKEMKEKTKKFCSDHRKALERTGLVLAGGAVVAAGFIARERYLQQSPEMGFGTPKLEPDGRYSISVCLFTKRNKSFSVGSAVFEKDVLKNMCNNWIKAADEVIDVKHK